MSETLDRYLELKHQVQTEEIPKLMDKSVALEERWKLFCKLFDAGVLGTNKCGNGYLNVLDPTGGLTMFDDFYTDRYETTSYVRMYERILKANASAEKYDEPRPYAQEAIDEWREEVLASGDGEMVSDW